MDTECTCRNPGCMALNVELAPWETVPEVLRAGTRRMLARAGRASAPVEPEDRPDASRAYTHGYELGSKRAGLWDIRFALMRLGL